MIQSIEEAHIELKVLIDKIDSSYYEEILPEEIDLILNNAYLRLVKRIYGRNNAYKKGFEESQKRTDDLKNLVKSGYCELELIDYFGNGDKVYKVNLSPLFSDKELQASIEDKYMFYLKSFVKACVGTCCSTTNVKLVQQDDLTMILNDPFNNPSLSKPIIFFENSSIYLWSGNKTIDFFHLTFIKEPLKVNIGTYSLPRQDFEVSNHLIDEIVIDASQIILEIIQSQRVQTNVQNLQLKE